MNCVDDRNFSNEENAVLIENGKTIKYVFEKPVYVSGIPIPRLDQDNPYGGDVFVYKSGKRSA